ncbi:MAG: hypothetical protein HYS13_13775 [Planctomycetia bacterium]|nr:hypothetical protein [Planctomycetia bacterium]
MPAVIRKDLIVVSADSQTDSALKGILTRVKSLAIREVQAEFFVNQGDAACYKRGDVFLRQFANQYHRALLVFDREGCGREPAAREEIEQEVQARLDRAGWDGRSAVIVIDPELEAWVWSESPQVVEILGWTGRQPPLRTWLEQQGFWCKGKPKPEHPKAAMDAALRAARRSRSSVHFSELGKKVGLARCKDPSFLRLKALLQSWFSS